MALGHPKGLFPLFFIEMWERLAFYTMLGVLLLYTTDLERGGLGLPAVEGNQIYGMYLAFVYFTPFLGGMIADRFMGYRRAVLIGGVLMAAGLFLMSTPGFVPFVAGLVCLVVGNGFFKPNISVMVGNLYEAGDAKRDAGFNIFYMGINIGAFFAGFLAASVRNELGWLWTFRVAGFGILIGLIILLTQWKLLERADRQPERGPEDTTFGAILVKILLPAFAFGIVGFFMASAWLPEGSALRPAVCGFLAGMIPVIVFFVRLGLKAKEAERPGLLALLPVYVAGGTFFMILHLNGSAMTQWARDNTDRAGFDWEWLQEAYPNYYTNAEEDVFRPDPRTLIPVEQVADARMFGQQRLDAAAVERIRAAAGDIEVVEWTPEQLAGQLSAEDQQWLARAADVYPEGVVSVQEGVDSHGAKTVTVAVEEGAKPIKKVAFLREVDDVKFAAYVVDNDTIAAIYDTYKQRYAKDPQLLPPGQFLRVINPEIYQSFNAIFVVLFTPLVVFIFAFLARKKFPITTARKIFIGLALTTVSLLTMALAGTLSDNGLVKVSSLWLIGFYAIVTFGELCLSPMSLSLVTKLSPKRLVGLTMGGWFLATSFGNNLSGFFGGLQTAMTPASFFFLLSGLAGLAALFIFLLLPRLDAAIKKYGA